MCRTTVIFGTLQDGSLQIIIIFFLSLDFYTKRSVGEGNDYILAQLTFWEIVLFVVIPIFWSRLQKKSQYLYSCLWDTLGMMLFTEVWMIWKRKRVGRIGWKFWYWFIIKFSLDQDTKRWTLYLSNAPLNNSFSYRSVFQNNINALSKMALKTSFFYVKKLKISCSLDHTLLFKFH